MFIYDVILYLSVVKHGYPSLQSTQNLRHKIEYSRLHSQTYVQKYSHKGIIFLDFNKVLKQISFTAANSKRKVISI